MSELFPNDLETLDRIYNYAIQLEKGVESMSDELKRVFTNLGLGLFSTYEKNIKETANPKRLNWEYISCLCQHFYSHYQVYDNYCFQLRWSKRNFMQLDCSIKLFILRWLVLQIIA